jgi:hypothetical protein
VLDEIDDNVHASHKRGDVERGEPRLCGGLDARAVLQQQLHHLYPVLLAGNVQRGEPVERPRVRVGLAVEEKLGDADVTAVGGNVQGSKVVDGNLVDRSLKMYDLVRFCHPFNKEFICL